MKNIFDLSNLSASHAEQSESLLRTDNLHIERIVSYGHPTPSGEWYDQPWEEWVVLLVGQARIIYPDQTAICLTAGDSLLIAPHVQHRVQDVSQDAIWLAVHHKGECDINI